MKLVGFLYKCCHAGKSWDRIEQDSGMVTVIDFVTNMNVIVQYMTNSKLQEINIQVSNTIAATFLTS